MKKMGRALALLLTLVMLFTTFGFAEEAEVVDLAPEAIEASEQPEESVEEPAEEAVEEPVEEAVEEPAEEPAEAPAEEPAEPAEEQPEEAGSDFSAKLENFGYIKNSCPAMEGKGGYHSFDENGRCTACGYTCPHGRVNTMYALEIKNDKGEDLLNNELAPVFAPIDADKHLVMMRYRYEVTQCLDCSKILGKKDLKKEVSCTVEAPHVFGDEAENDSCLLCGYVKNSKCTHENRTTVEYEEIEGYEQIDGVNHQVKGTKYPNAEKCLDCGEILAKGEGEEFTRTEPHIKRRFVQQYDEEYGYGYVWWDDIGEASPDKPYEFSAERPYDIEVHCACGYNFYDESENYVHTHQWVECTEERDERYVPIDGDLENHNRVVDVYKGKQCSICGIHLEMKKIEEKPTKEPHVLDSGFCTVCGMSQNCAHPKEVLDGVYTADELKQKGLLEEGAPDAFKALDDRRHMVSSKLYRLYVCSYCREPLRYEPDDNENVRVDEHVWKNGKCTLCGYTCKHENKYTDFYGSAKYSLKKKKGIVDKKVHITTPLKSDYMQQSCAICDKIFVSYKKTKKSFEEPHLFEDGICVNCGYVLDCDHADAREIAEVRYGSRIVNTGDVNGHEVVGSYSICKLCPDCGCEFEVEGLEYNGGTAPHRYNDSGICWLCGYAKEGAAPVALSVQKTKQLGVGETWESAQALNIAPKPKTETDVTYTSGNKKIFEVDANGKVTAKKAGKAKLTVKCGSLKATCTVTVKKAATSIAFESNAITLGVGQRTTLTAKLSPKKSFANVSYASDNPCVEVVDAAAGKIRAVSAGTAKITATAIDGKLKAECTVTVTEAPTTISLGDVPKQMGKGEKFTIEPELLDAAGKPAGDDVRYMSSNTKVLKVGEHDGKVTAAGTGTAKIYAFAYNGVQGVAEVEVKKAPKGIILSSNDTSVELKAGDTYTVKAEVASDAASQLSWGSNKEQYATVESTGNPGEFEITAVSAGKAKITFSTFNKKKKIINVTVK